MTVRRPETSFFDPETGAAIPPPDLIAKASPVVPTSEAVRRKQAPMATGVLDYFPDALEDVARCSWAGNEQHHPGTPLHWDKNKSTDEADALMRHLKDRGTRDTDGIRHSTKVAWRALANLQREIDREKIRGKSEGA